jgi:tetratricopeptide (TPR) repeat protein
MTKKNKEPQSTSTAMSLKLPTDARGFQLQAIILMLIGFIFYSNSFLNEYALDDGIVIQKNEYVQEGFRGIKKILKTDAYDSFYKQMNAKQQLSGGRYRPLSIVTFAIEQQLFGDKEHPYPTELSSLRHLVNVIFYILSIILLLYFLREYIFETNPFAAFVIALLFLIHPIHTEVVANVKSRDEILSFMFIILTFIYSLRYFENRQTKHLFLGLLFYFFALLSKEYAVTLIVLIPMLWYIKKSTSFQRIITAWLPFFVIAIIYLAIRYSVVGKGATIENPDVLNNPYKFATPDQRLATKLEILNHYLRLLFYPNPLSSDYSYNTIPYTDFSNFKVWAAIGIHLSMIAAAIILFFKRNILAFALTFYLVHLLMISNLKFEIGATMGERLIYHSSFGFCIVIGMLVAWILQEIKKKTTSNAVGAILAIVVVLWCAAITYARNAEWKNDTTLFIADAEKVPNSALVNGNAGKGYIDLSELPENKDNKKLEKELIEKAIYYLKRSVSIHKEYVNGYLNLGVAYFKLQDYDKAKENWDRASEIYPNNPFLKRNRELLGATYYNEAMKFGMKQPQEAIRLLEKAVEIVPTNADYWYNIGGASYTIQDFKKARMAWTKTLELKPDYEQARQGLAAIQGK